MTTLALKTPVSRKLIASCETLLGDNDLKSGRYWYKGNQNCDLVILRKGRNILVHASGGVRFRLSLTSFDDGAAEGSLGLLGWLRETPNAIRILSSLLDQHSKEVQRRRELKLALETKAEAEGDELPEFTEAMGSHFSVKADEEKLEDRYRISESESERNFAMAVKSRWYHQGFANFCRQQGVKCYYKPVFGEEFEEQLELENSSAVSAAAVH